MVVGAGPSFPKNYESIRNFPGKILLVDSVFNSCVRNGIIPDCVMTMESGKARKMIAMFDKECLEKCKGGTSMIVSPITKQQLVDHVKNYMGYKKHFFYDKDGNEELQISNVGLFALLYAYRTLKADKIFIIGFEHTGKKYSEYCYREWATAFWYYVKKFPKGTVINCSDGGVLYFKDYVIKATLDELEISS